MGGLNVARQLSANGGVRAPDRLRLVPDAATANMANLKRVKFLDPEFEAPSKQSRGQLTDEYLRKKSALDSQLQKVIDRTRVAKMAVPKKSKEEMEKEAKEKEELLAKNPIAKLLESAKPKKDPNVLAEEEKYADGFIRSKRNTMMRVK